VASEAVRFAPFGPKVDSEVFVDVTWADPQVEQAMKRVDEALAEVGAGSSLVDANKMVDLLLDIRLDLLGVPA
jgi:hypothetical protein